MNPANYKLSKEVLNDLIQRDRDNYKGGKYQSFFGTNVKMASPADRAQVAIDEVFHILSTPLKKMQRDYLNNVSKNCYPEKHVSDSFTNIPQINICKSQEH